MENNSLISENLQKLFGEMARWLAYLSGFRQRVSKLGGQVEQNLWVANLIGQHGIGKKGPVPPIRYEAIREGLKQVALFAREHQAGVHMPRLGSGLAGGDWQNISRITLEELVNEQISVTVYDPA